jgi:hypothetical protein
MQPEPVSPEELGRLSPEEQAAYWQEHIEDWPAFVDGILASRAEWAAHRAAGGEGPPPGWISAREYLRERLLRSDL